MTKEITIVDLKKEIDVQVSDVNTLNTLLATTFKGLSKENVKPAILEGRLRGFTFKDFLVKNVYAIKYGQGYSLVTSIDNNRKIGMRSGVVGTTKPLYIMTNEKTEANLPKPKSCEITVKRMINGYIGDFTAEVSFDEYYKAGKTYEGKYTPSMWDTKPLTMIAKVAEMHALRKACPEELSQAYVEEEMIQEAKPVPVVDVSGFETKLREAKTLTELQTAWKGTPVEVQTLLVELKEELKKKFEPAITKDDMPNFK